MSTPVVFYHVCTSFSYLPFFPDRCILVTARRFFGNSTLIPCLWLCRTSLYGGTTSYLTDLTDAHLACFQPLAITLNVAINNPPHVALQWGLANLQVEALQGFAGIRGPDWVERVTVPSTVVSPSYTSPALSACPAPLWLCQQACYQTVSFANLIFEQGCVSVVRNFKTAII